MLSSTVCPDLTALIPVCFGFLADRIIDGQVMHPYPLGFVIDAPEKSNVADNCVVINRTLHSCLIDASCGSAMLHR